MKTSTFFACGLLGLAMGTQPLMAQSGINPAPVSSGATPPAPTPWAAARSDAHSRTWQRTTYETRPNGQVVPHVHSYTEVATGLNHLVDGQWVPSTDQIAITATGAQAVNAQHQVIFLGDLAGGGNNGAIQLTTPDGKQLKSNILGLGYYDTSSGQSVLFSELTNSIGAVTPSANEALYTNAFTDIDADVSYHFSKAGFEQFIILREQPPSPSQYGLNPATTLLQVLTEFLNPPAPGIAVESIRSRASPSSRGSSRIRRLAAPITRSRFPRPTPPLG